MKEDIQRLLDGWQKTYEDLKQQTAYYQNPQTKDLSRAVQCQGKALAIGECIVQLYALVGEAPRSLSSSDRSNSLLNSIKEQCRLFFRSPPRLTKAGMSNSSVLVSACSISISLMPELMHLDCVFYKDHACSIELVTRICNDVNLTPWPAMLTVDENGGIVNVSVRLFLAAESRIPDEGLVRAIIPASDGR